MDISNFDIHHAGTLFPDGSAPFNEDRIKSARKSGYLEGLADFIRDTYEKKLKTDFFLTDDEIDRVFSLMSVGKRRNPD
jgi:hypothetical protein